eukprot:412130_1
MSSVTKELNLAVKYYTGQTWQEWTKDPIYILVSGIDNLQNDFFSKKQFMAIWTYTDIRKSHENSTDSIYKLGGKSVVRFVLWNCNKETENSDANTYRNIYSKNVAGIMWFVDKQNMKQSQIKLHQLLNHEELTDVPLNIIVTQWQSSISEKSITDIDIENNLCIDSKENFKMFVIKYFIRNNGNLNVPSGIIHLISKYYLKFMNRDYCITNCLGD